MCIFSKFALSTRDICMWKKFLIIEPTVDDLEDGWKGLVKFVPILRITKCVPQKRKVWISVCHIHRSSVFLYGGSVRDFPMAESQLFLRLPPNNTVAMLDEWKMSQSAFVPPAETKTDGRKRIGASRTRSGSEFTHRWLWSVAHHQDSLGQSWMRVPFGLYVITSQLPLHHIQHLMWGL